MFRLSTFCVALTLLLQPVSAATEVQLKWTELGAVAMGHDVKLVLPSNTVVHGQIQAVRDDTLIMTVTRTSDAKAFPKGQNSIPKASISVVEVKTYRGIAGRTTGTTIGVVGGLSLTGTIIGHSDMSAVPALAVAIIGTAAAAIGGYHAGKAADVRVTRIRITQ